MNEYTLCFNGCPQFWGTLEECEMELSKRATSDRLRRFYCIKSPEAVEEIRAKKEALDSMVTKHHSAPTFDRDGDVIYYH